MPARSRRRVKPAPPKPPENASPETRAGLAGLFACTGFEYVPVPAGAKPYQWDPVTGLSRRAGAERLDNVESVPADRWLDGKGNEFQAGTHYFVGGNTKFYGAALFRMRKEDFGELRHHDGISPAWPVSYDEMEPYYAAAGFTQWYFADRTQPMTYWIDKLATLPFEAQPGERPLDDADERSRHLGRPLADRLRLLLQDLVDEHQFSGSYWSVMRFVRRLGFPPSLGDDPTMPHDHEAVQRVYSFIR